MSCATVGLVVTALAGAITVSTLDPAAARTSGGAPAATAVATAGATTGANRAAHYTVSSFNVLGASHTPAGGRWASGERRIVHVKTLLNRHHVDVVGFQEMQASQLTTFTRITHGNWSFYPGLRLRRIDSENSIAWRRDQFDLVDATTVNIPYFDGYARPMPVVLLRDKRSKMMTYFSNFHTPAETAQYHHQGHWRAEAIKIQVALQKQLVTSGIPRIMTGDMNDRAAYFCAVTAGAPLRAARPTSWRRGRTCHADRPRAVDWILGSIRLDYSHYVEDRGPLVDITTDHPVIVSDVTVQPSALPNGWLLHPPAHLVPRVSWHRP